MHEVSKRVNSSRADDDDPSLIAATGLNELARLVETGTPGDAGRIADLFGNKG
jgi:hypothetical protein